MKADTNHSLFFLLHQSHGGWLLGITHLNFRLRQASQAAAARGFGLLLSGKANRVTYHSCPPSLQRSQIAARPGFHTDTFRADTLHRQSVHFQIPLWFPGCRPVLLFFGRWVDWLVEVGLPFALRTVTIVLGIRVKVLRSRTSDWGAEEGGVNWVGDVRVYRQTTGEYKGGIQ